MIGEVKWNELTDEEIIQNLMFCIRSLNTGINECEQRNLRLEIAITHFNKPLNAARAIRLLKAWKDFSLE